LTDLLSVESKWSILPLTSREICTRHLVPLLSLVSARSELNKMTAENLAVCFAPTLVCGPDQLEDVKISSIIRRVLTTAGELWSTALREACGVDEGAFARDIQAPSRIEDYEDPLDTGSSLAHSPVSPGFTEEQQVGIILKDNDDPMEMPPPLPPRQSVLDNPERLSFAEGPHRTMTMPPPLPPRSIDSQDSLSGWQPEELSVRRKPAPPLVVPPRYSTVAGDPNDVTESPSTYSAVTNGFGPQRRSDWSFDSGVPDSFTIHDSPIDATPAGSRQNSMIRRKPVIPTSSWDEAKKETRI